MPDLPRILQLVRHDPALLEQALGVVADAVVFPDGTAVLHWRTVPASTEVYPSETAMRDIREHSGRSHFETPEKPDA